MTKELERGKSATKAPRHSTLMLDKQTCHSRGLGMLGWVSSFSGGFRHSRVGGNLVEVLVPAFAGMTFLRWDGGGCWGDVSSMGGVILAWVESFSRRRESG